MFKNVRRALLRVALASVAAVAVASAGGATSAYACSPSGGSDCLPGSGYTLDSTWNCGFIAALTRCFYAPNNAGTTNEGSAQNHSWGWGSGDYDGAGNVGIIICMELGSTGDCRFSAGANNLVRDCYYSSCNDQNEASDKIYIKPSAAHTIYGHAKA